MRKCSCHLCNYGKSECWKIIFVPFILFSTIFNWWHPNSFIHWSLKCFYNLKIIFQHLVNLHLKCYFFYEFLKNYDLHQKYVKINVSDIQIKSENLKCALCNFEMNSHSTTFVLCHSFDESSLVDTTLIMMENCGFIWDIDKRSRMKKYR